MMINITPTFTTKQKIAIKILLDNNNSINELLFGGGAGSGKSFLGCIWIIIMCLKYPETRYLIGRSKLSALKLSTLRTFFEVAKLLQLTDEDYKYNQQNNVITFTNGSEVILKDLFTYPSDPEFDSLGSIEITGAFIDECNQVSEKAKNIVMSRIRYRLDEYDLIPKIYMSCNPSKNWVYNTFYKPHKDNNIEPYRVFIQSLATDNQFISKHYISNLEKLDPQSRMRLLEGKWEYSDELSIFNYDSIINMFNDQPIPLDTFYMSVDVARLGKDKTIIMVWSGYRVVEFVELSKQTLDLQSYVIKDLMNKYKLSVNNICFDVDGVGGGLKDMFKGSREIVNNSKAINNENYQNLKTQLYYKLADKINNNIICCSVLDQNNELKLTQELQVIKREKIDQDGKICMTSKDKIKQMIGRSNDISDCMAYRMIFDLKPKVSFSIDIL